MEDIRVYKKLNNGDYMEMSPMDSFVLSNSWYPIKMTLLGIIAFVIIMFLLSLL